MLYQKKPLKYISLEAERMDTEQLIRGIEKDQWMDSDTIIVACQPEYSSSLAQILNHKMCYKNGNELWDMTQLLIPSKTMSQVWNIDTWEYEVWDKYLIQWIQKVIKRDGKYLFVFCGKDRSREFNKIKMLSKDKADIRFAFLYLSEESTFTPDYFVSRYQDKLIFSWENYDNPST